MSHHQAKAIIQALAEVVALKDDRSEIEKQAAALVKSYQAKETDGDAEDAWLDRWTCCYMRVLLGHEKASRRRRPQLPGMDWHSPGPTQSSTQILLDAFNDQYPAVLPRDDDLYGHIIQSLMTERYYYFGLARLLLGADEAGVSNEAVFENTNLLMIVYGYLSIWSEDAPKIAGLVRQIPRIHDLYREVEHVEPRSFDRLNQHFEVSDTEFDYRVEKCLWYRTLEFSQDRGSSRQHSPLVIALWIVAGAKQFLANLPSSHEALQVPEHEMTRVCYPDQNRCMECVTMRGEGSLRQLLYRSTYLGPVCTGDEDVTFWVISPVAGISDCMNQKVAGERVVINYESFPRHRFGCAHLADHMAYVVEPLLIHNSGWKRISDHGHEAWTARAQHLIKEDPATALPPPSPFLVKQQELNEEERKHYLAHKRKLDEEKRTREADSEEEAEAEAEAEEEEEGTQEPGTKRRKVNSLNDS